MLSETSTKVKVHHNIVSKIPVPQTQKMNHGDDFFHIVSSSIIQFTKAYNETCRETEHMCPFYQLAMGIISMEVQLMGSSPFQRPHSYSS